MDASTGQKRRKFYCEIQAISIVRYGLSDYSYISKEACGQISLQNTRFHNKDFDSCINQLDSSQIFLNMVLNCSSSTSRSLLLSQGVPSNMA